VEQYERIELSGIPEAEVIGAAVTDLVHLLAELLENATSFSSPQTRVTVNATRLPDGRVLVEIHDKGIGLSAEDFAEINEKLADPPTVDASISRRMGLFVVGRLSDRHNIRVQLRPSGESAGTTSLVMLPTGLTHMKAMPEPEEQFTVSRIFADQGGDQWEQEAFAAQRTAAELGFDDNLASGNSSGGFSPALDSMQRSLRLEQRRRGALEPGGDEYAEQSGQPDYGYQQQGAYQQQEYVEAEFVESEPEYPNYQQPQSQSPYAEQPYQDGLYAEPGYQQAQYGRQDFYGEQQRPQQQPQQFAEYQQYEQGYQEPPRFDGFAPRPAERAGGHPYGEQPPALPAAPQQPAAPAAPALGGPQGTLGSGLPQRRPGEQLAGGGLPTRAIGGPERGEQPNWFTGARDTSGGTADNSSHVVSGLGTSGPTGPTTAAWQGANDVSWQRAEQLREPSAGGVTGAGLPRRVPKQNLVPGNAQPVPGDGPQVSRSPEEVRGRLTNLRRGVEQGRSAGGDATGSFRIDPQDMSRPGRTGMGQQNHSTDLFGGSNHQER
jgi:hypothetical protein